MDTVICKDCRRVAERHGAWLKQVGSVLVCLHAEKPGESRDDLELRAIWDAVRQPDQLLANVILRSADARPESFDLVRRLYGMTFALRNISEYVERSLGGGHHEALEYVASVAARGLIWK